MPRGSDFVETVILSQKKPIITNGDRTPDGKIWQHVTQKEKTSKRSKTGTITNYIHNPGYHQPMKQRSKIKLSEYLREVKATG